MTKYDIILEELQNRVDSGEISYEFAESVNELAYDKYVSEADDNKAATIAGIAFAGIFVGIFGVITANLIKIVKANKQLNAKIKKAEKDYEDTAGYMKWESKFQDLVDYTFKIQLKATSLDSKCKAAKSKIMKLLNNGNKEEYKRYISDLESDCIKAVAESERASKELISFLKSTPKKYMEAANITQYEIDDIISLCEKNLEAIEKFKKEKDNNK